MGGLLITSITSGQLISRTGRYKPFPIAGTAIMVVGLALLSTMDAHTTRLAASGFMFVLGLGLGLVMQVLVLAVQNAVEYKDLGVATSGATLFRSIGGSVGTAVLGSIFSNQLSSKLASTLPASAKAALGSGGSVTLNTAKLAKLPPPIHTIYTTAFTDALSTVFVVASAIAAAAFLLSWLLEQRPLRDSIAAGTGIGESFAVPKHTDSFAEAARALTALIGRDARRHRIERLAERAGVNLSAAACWLVVRLHEDPAADVPALCEAFDIPAEVGEHVQARSPRGGVLGGLRDVGYLLVDSSCDEHLNEVGSVVAETVRRPELGFLLLIGKTRNILEPINLDHVLFRRNVCSFTPRIVHTYRLGYCLPSRRVAFRA